MIVPEIPCQHCGKTLRIGAHFLVCPGEDGNLFLFPGGNATVDQFIFRRPVADKAWCSHECAAADGFPWMSGEKQIRAPQGRASAAGPSPATNI